MKRNQEGKKNVTTSSKSDHQRRLHTLWSDQEKKECKDERVTGI